MGIGRTIQGAGTSHRATSGANLSPNGTGWDRRRLLAVLAATTVAAIALLVGLVYAAAHAVGAMRGTDSPTPPATGITASPEISPGAAGGSARRDQIASAPMLEVPVDAMNPVPSTTHDPTDDLTDGGARAQITVPPGTDLGPASVLTGFPHTPEGAVGQLGQIETTVLQAMSLPAAYDAYQAWALPGGVGAQGWRLTQSVQIFLDDAGRGQGKDPTVTVTAEPVAGLVKGTDGPDWVTACVLAKVTAVYRTKDEVAFGHCERMQWVGGRWMLAPGTPPAAAPSTWPGTELAREAGWRDWMSAAPFTTTPTAVPTPIPTSTAGGGHS